MSKRGKLALGLIGLTLVWLVLVAGAGTVVESHLREQLQLAGPVVILLALVVGHFVLGPEDDATPQ